MKIGTIKKIKHQALAAWVLNASKGKKKAKDSKQPDKKKPDRPNIPDGGLNPCKDKDKKGKEKMKCTYLHKGCYPKSSFMKKKIDTMA